MGDLIYHIFKIGQRPELIKQIDCFKLPILPVHISCAKPYKDIILRIQHLNVKSGLATLF